MAFELDSFLLDDKAVTVLSQACETLCHDMEAGFTAEQKIRDPDGYKLLTDPESLRDYIGRHFTMSEYKSFVTAYLWLASKIKDASENRQEKMLSQALWEKTEDAKAHMDGIADALTQFIDIAGNILAHVRKFPSKPVRNKIRRAMENRKAST